MGTFLQDLRFSLRSLRRAPAFPIAAISTLALGIGATTAIFTTLNAVFAETAAIPRPGTALQRPHDPHRWARDDGPGGRK
jgi:hypothetical protein